MFDGGSREGGYVCVSYAGHVERSERRVNIDFRRIISAEEVGTLSLKQVAFAFRTD